MSIRPPKEMYGTRIGLVLDIQGIPGRNENAHENILLEGILSEKCKDDRPGPKLACPDPVILEEARSPNLGEGNGHPLGNGVHKFTIEQKYIRAWYVPKPQQPSAEGSPE